MKNKIQAVYSHSVFQVTSAETIYVADFTDRTRSVRKVEIHTSFPRKKKMLFNDFPYRDVYEMTRWVKEYGIHLIVANEVNVSENFILTI